MKRAVNLVFHLRTAGAHLSVNEGRLAVEAPRGVITPELHAQMTRHKKALISILGQEQNSHCVEQAAVAEAISQVASLMAKAYVRYQRIAKVPVLSSEVPIPSGLALIPARSVHGCAL